MNTTHLGKGLLGTCTVLLGLAVSAGRAQDGAASPRMTLPEFINLGLEKQPALAAARASLAAAQTGQQALNSMGFARLLARDLPIRQQQSCLGVTIASAMLEQAEWETRYAVVRNYYSVIYAREQQKVVNGLQGKLDRAHKRAVELLKIGGADLKITQIDVDVLALNLELVKTKQAEAAVGILKAQAALREAIGVGLDYPLAVSEEDTLPALVKDFNKEELIAQALARRGEMAQASSAYQVTQLEIQAQSRSHCPKVGTFAGGADIHAKPVPQGFANGYYQPGAIGLEMPPMLVGNKNMRMQRARDLSDRASAVVDKTNNLITLEVEATYLKWKEASQKVQNLADAPKKAKAISDNVQKRFDNGNVSGEELLRARTLEDQVQAAYNEALYTHALGLAALERVTAGGYRITAQPAAQSAPKMAGDE